MADKPLTAQEIGKLRSGMIVGFAIDEFRGLASVARHLIADEKIAAGIDTEMPAVLVKVLYTDIIAENRNELFAGSVIERLHSIVVRATVGELYEYPTE